VRGNWKIIGNGIGIHWRLIDEHISVASMFTAEEIP